MRTFGRQFAWVTIGRLCAAVIQAVIMLVLIRSLPPERFGLLAAVFGGLIIPQTLFDAGLSTFIIRERAQDRTSPRVYQALSLGNRLSLALTSILVVVCLVLGFYVDHQYLYMAPLCVWAGAERNADVWLGVVIADGDTMVSSMNWITRRVSNLILFVFLLILTPIDPVLAFSTSSAVAAVGSLVLAHSHVSHRVVRGASEPKMQIFRDSWPYWINALAVQARNLDTALTHVLAGPIQAGLYAVPARLTGPLRLIPQSLASVLLPYATKSNHQTLRRSLKLIFRAFAFLTLLYAALIAIVPYVVPILLGENYVLAVVPLQIACGGLVFASVTELLTPLAQGVGLKHYVASAAVTSTILSISGVMVGAILNGASGAALGMSIAAVVQSTLLFGRIALFNRRMEDYS